MLLRVGELEVQLRAANPGDVPVLLRFIREMAAFERLSVSTTEELLHEALFGAMPAGQSLIALVEEQPMGYVTYCYTFSSMTGRRVLFLDDLYIDPAFRNKGIGKAVMGCLARMALENGCARLDWTVLDWNKSAIEFYKGLGAEVLADWRIARLEGDSLLAAGKKSLANAETE
jgi:GNAT superfamily N-acetyltransferase